MAPQNVQVSRLNGTHMNVTWQRLSLEEARGFPIGYIITLEDVGASRQRRVALTSVSGPEDSYKVIGGLDLTTQYSVSVGAATSEGGGLQSTEVLLEGKNIITSLSYGT